MINSLFLLLYFGTFFGEWTETSAMIFTLIKQKLLPVLGCFIFFGFTSCEKDSIFLSTEKRVQGKWRYEKVEFQKNFSFNKKSVTSDYRDLIIEFKSDNSIVQTSNLSGRDEVGKWDVKRAWFEDGTDQINRYIEGHLTNVSTGNKRNLEWRNLRVTRKRMTFTKHGNGGTYRFKLRKQ